MSEKETRRAVLQKSAGAATFLAGAGAFSGSAAAASDADYRIVIEDDGGDGGSYKFKVPYGNDDSLSVSDQDTNESDESLTDDYQDREVICEGEVEAGGEDHWETTSSGKPYAVEEYGCTVHVYQKT